MSQIIVRSPKHCGAKQANKLVSGLDTKLYKKVLCLLSALLTALLSVILLFWLILRPSSPHLSLREADVYQLRLSSAPHRLNSSLEVTLVSYNPNSRVGVFYDDLTLYASYKGQQITLDATLPPFYQDCRDSTILTASLVGAGLPVAPSFGYEVQRDQTAGKLVLNLKGHGRLRWKVGAWVSGRYRFFLNCVAVMPFGPVVPSGPLTVKQGTQCSIDI